MVYIRGFNFEISVTLNWEGRGSKWTTFHSPLPWTVEIHGGNACLNTLGGDYDNTWIKYSSESVNIPTDSGCQPTNVLSKGWRCTIPQRP